jgi:para-nitrobenzyl esterase
MKNCVSVVLLAIVVALFAAPTTAASQTSASELAGTSWRLVKISSMDDTTAVPDDPSHYTLSFGADGSASIRADCNRGSGSWSSEGPSQLKFGPLATTRAMCPPGSLSDKYVAQFEYVRSYVFSDGHLFIATMADGSIIEFEPDTE